MFKQVNTKINRCKKSQYPSKNNTEMTVSKCLKKKKPASSTISFLLCCLININIFYYLQKVGEDRALRL